MTDTAASHLLAFSGVCRTLDLVDVEMAVDLTQNRRAALRALHADLIDERGHGLTADDVTFSDLDDERTASMAVLLCGAEVADMHIEDQRMPSCWAISAGAVLRESGEEILAAEMLLGAPRQDARWRETKWLLTDEQIAQAQRRAAEWVLARARARISLES